MTNEEKKFLEQFKAGEYATVTILVKLNDLDSFVDTLRTSGLTLAVLPSVKSEIDFASINNKGTSQ